MSLVYSAFASSLILSVGRNLLSKSISGFEFGTSDFFTVQSIIFFGGFIGLIIPAALSFPGISLATLVQSLIYAILLLAAQWNYTAALKNGNTAMCVTVYSLGFILPAISGFLFWGEDFTSKNFCGLILAASAVAASGFKKGGSATGGKYFLPLIISMLASGGLGIMQKVQQSSSAKSETLIFISAAFLIAGSISYICKLSRGCAAKLPNGAKMRATAVGICFACCNLLNTFLAGKLNSVVFFPVQNVSVIVLSLLVSIPIFRERFGKKEVLVVLLGLGAVFLNN